MTLYEQYPLYQQVLIHLAIYYESEIFGQSSGRWLQEKTIVLDKMLNEIPDFKTEAEEKINTLSGQDLADYLLKQLRIIIKKNKIKGDFEDDSN